MLCFVFVDTRLLFLPDRRNFQSPCSTCEERQIDVCMNASCAFQHFCDIHGPQILLCTEAQPYVHEHGGTQEENLNAIYSQYIKPEQPQYIKSEHPQGKAECKVNVCKKETDRVKQVLSFSRVRSPPMVCCSPPLTPSIICYSSLRRRHPIKIYSKIYVTHAYEV